MTSHETRKAFLDYFGAQEHRIVPSSPLVLPNDPTLLFANAGMNQFKEVFTGRERRDYVRAASSQKCLRVSGKHNDLEMVGRTPRHHTFFEMLGNFSFGDYFKRRAIAFAWELVTGVYGLPDQRLWVSVFEGDASAEADEEAFGLWRDEIGVPRERILRLGAKDNFWRMGDTGPCGPCSEIFYDLGPKLTSVEGPSTPATDERRFVEVWNLVFMQFDQQSDGTLRPLPAPSIDTGMGLERIVSVLQDRSSNYETDIFVPILDAAALRAGVRYGDDAEVDFSLRVIADHARAFCFLVGDGVVPANDKRGYVLRRLLRRAIRHGRKLGINEPFLDEVTPVVIEMLGDVYPEIGVAREAILEIGDREERRFAETLATGLVLLEKDLARLEPSSEQPPVLPGKELFRLYDTFGFPLDLARDVAEERGVKLDETGFEAEMQRQRARAKASWKGGARAEVGQAYRELAERHPTRFEGYGQYAVDGVRVLALRREGAVVERLERGAVGEVLLDASPFYAESGGQVADRGVLTAGSGRGEVVDVQRPADGLIVHTVHIRAGELAVGESVHAEVDAVRRRATMRNHTATHLLHAALRDVVGSHVKQAGSLVAPDRLRFDFTHFSPLSEAALLEIESLVNRKVLEDLPVETAEVPIDEALKRGAMALFGEKYGERVRIVRIGEFSLELCGGTHTSRTGQIGLVKLTQERGIASGTRRVEAISGEGSLACFRDEHAIVRSLEERLSVPPDRVLAEIERRLDQIRDFQRELERQRLEHARGQFANKVETPQIVEGVKLVAERVEGLGAQEMRELADALRGKLHSGVVVLGRADGEKAALLVAVTDDLKDRLPAGSLVRPLGRIIGGGGGGRSDMAEAGGKDPARLDEALTAAAGEIKRLLESSSSQ
jgi:alanyl-tRNA synthetase